MTAEQATTYDAFLSYSHAADGQLAPALQVAVQRFATPWYRLRRMRLFRDNTGLSANSGLWSSIEDALGGSTWFVLFASPDAAESKWVNDEVALWLKRHGTERLLVVVTDGEFTWNEDGPSGSAVPPVLAAASMAEPRWIDLRWARTSEQLDRRDPRFREAVADLAATLAGVAKDFLIGEDVRQYRRGRRLATAAGAVLAVLVLVAAVLGVTAANRQAAATAQQKTRSANNMIVEADVVRARDPQAALQLDVAAQRLDPGQQREGALLQDLTSPFLGALPGHGKAVTATAWSADGHRFAIADGTGRVTTSAPDALAAASTFTVDPGIVGLAFAPDGGRLAVLTTNKVELVPLADPARRSSVPLPGRGVDLAVTAGGAVLAVANNQLVRWAPDGTPTTQPLPGAGQRVLRAAFALDGRLLATVSSDGGVRLWDVTAAPRPLGVVAPTAEEDTLVAFDPAQHVLVVGHADSTVEFWDIADPRTPTQPKTPITTVERTLTTLAVDRSGQIATASIDGSISLISGSSTTSLRTPAATPLKVAFAPDGSRLISGYLDGSAALWNTAPDRGPELASVQPNGHAGALLTVEAAHAGGSFATAGNNGVALWDTPAPGKIAPHPGLITAPGTAFSLAFSPDDRVIAVGTTTGHVCFVDTAVSNPTCARDVSLSSSPVKDLAAVLDLDFLPGGKTVVAVGEGFGVRLIDVASGKATVMDPIEGALTVAVTGDGRQLLASYRGSFAYRRWDISDPSKPTALDPVSTNHDIAAVQALAITLNGTLISAGRDGKIVLTALDGADNTELGEIPTAIGPQTLSNASAVLALSVSPDGRELAAAGDDGLVGLWDITDPSRPRPIGPIHRVFSADVYGIAISADGQTLVSGGADPRIAAWDLRPVTQLRHSAVQTACTRSGDPLPPAAWTRLTDLAYQDTCASS